MSFPKITVSEYTFNKNQMSYTFDWFCPKASPVATSSQQESNVIYIRVILSVSFPSSNFLSYLGGNPKQVCELLDMRKLENTGW